MKAIKCDLCNRYESMSGWTVVISGPTYEVCTVCKTNFEQLRDKIRKTAKNQG